MGEHPLDLQVGHFFHGGDLAGGPVYILGLIADAAHAGVYGDEHMDLLALADGFIGEGLGVALGAGDGGDIILHHSVGIQVRRQAQADDLFLGAGLPQGDGLLQGGDGKDLAAVLPQDLCALHGAVAVGIGLDDADDLPLGADLLHDILDVVVQVGKIDLCPDGTNGFFIHRKTSFLQAQFFSRKHYTPVRMGFQERSAIFFLAKRGILGYRKRIGKTQNAKRKSSAKEN